MRVFSATVSASAAGNTYSQVFVPDTYIVPFNLSFVVEVPSTAHYTVEHTLSDPFSLNLNTPTNGRWLQHEFLVNASATDDGNYAFPVRALRLVVSAANDGYATITIMQAGPE